MSKIDRIIQAINEDDTSDETWSVYFEKGFSFKLTIFSKGFNERQDWSVSYGMGPSLLDLLLFIERPSVDVIGANGSRYPLALTKAQRKALDKAYWGWYERQKQRHKFNAKEAAK